MNALRRYRELITKWDEAIEDEDVERAEILAIAIRDLKATFPEIQEDIDPPAEITDPM